jgi:hypothetical protein
MKSMREQVLKHVHTLPEGSAVTARELLHLGTRAAADQALCRLAREGVLLRTGRGLYVLPVQSRFGARPPATQKVVEALAEKEGVIVASHGAAAANSLGMTTQVPVRGVYLTSGRSRRLRLGAQTVELRHVPRWQLLYPNHQAGEVVRTLAWLGPVKSKEAMPELRRKLAPAVWADLFRIRSQLPTWMAGEVSKVASQTAAYA